MNSLESWVVNSLLQKKGVKMGEPYDHRADKNLFLQLFLQILQQPGEEASTDHNTRSIAPQVYMIDGGTPEFFILSQLKPPLVWYSKSYIDRFARLRYLIMTEPQNPHFSDETLAIIFRTLSDFFLETEKHDSARACFLQSLIQARDYRDDLDYYDGLLFEAHKILSTREFDSEAIAGLVCLYCGFSHELGHFLVEFRPSHFPQTAHPLPTDPGAIKNEWEKSLKQVIDSTGIGVLFAESDLQRAFEDFFETSNLQTEVMADWVGTTLLSNLIDRLQAVTKNTYSKKVFVSETIVGFFIIQALEICHQLTGDAAHLSRIEVLYNRVNRSLHSSTAMDGEDLGRKLSQETFLQGIAATHWTRVQHLRPTLQTLMLRHFHPDTFRLCEGAPASTVCGDELRRREGLAAQNLEACFGFYDNAFRRILYHFSDALSFLSHLSANIPPSVPGLNPTKATDFQTAIAGNMRAHLAGLDSTEDGKTRKSWITSRLIRIEDPEINALLK
jgi:hypothetical protein